MSALLLGSVCTALLIAAYIFYGSRLVSLFGVEPGRRTPAHEKFDGIDYVPASHWTVLFGHHFASIAGAAPVIGPVLAVSLWGWGPALLWIVIGSIFIGGVHDFGSLMLSVKHGGGSIADITERVISRRARLCFSLFVWLTLILIIAVFVHLCARTLTVEPRVVVPSLGLVAVALLTGHLIYRRRWNQAAVTAIGLGILASLIIIGDRIPIVIGGTHGLAVWGCILLVYSFAASITPVNILLQPRDYMAAYLLLFGVLFGFSGILVSRPAVSVPFFSGWSVSGKALFPLLFVTVACGSISGFHSLVASGTTSKQMAAEEDGRRVGYGAMLAEGAVAVLAVLAVAAGLSRVELSTFMAAGGAGPIGAFGSGFGALTKPFLGAFGGFFAIVVLNAFIFTTLDTATRISRYLTQEIFGIRNMYLATFIVVGLGGWLGLSGQWSRIWPIFGAANQLVAALALLVVSAWLMSRSQKVMYTLVPAGIMLLITIAALVYNIPVYWKGGSKFLLTVSAALLAIAVYLLLEMAMWFKRRSFSR